MCGAWAVNSGVMRCKTSSERLGRPTEDEEQRQWSVAEVCSSH